MKDKEPEGYIEKPRVHRDRSKKRRLSQDEKVNSDDTKPRKSRSPEDDRRPREPYHRDKRWINQIDEE